MTDAGGTPHKPVLGKRKNAHHWEAKVWCAMCDSRWTLTHEDITPNAFAAWPDLKEWTPELFTHENDRAEFDRLRCSRESEDHECSNGTWTCDNCKCENVMCLTDVPFRTRLWWDRRPESSKRRKLDKPNDQPDNNAPARGGAADAAKAADKGASSATPASSASSSAS